MKMKMRIIDAAENAYGFSNEMRHCETAHGQMQIVHCLADKLSISMTTAVDSTAGRQQRQ